MREPKRLAHRQAERNKARVLKRWSWDDNDEDLLTGVRPAQAIGQERTAELLLVTEPAYQG